MKEGTPLQVRGKGSKEEVRPGVWRVRFFLGKDPETGKYSRTPWRYIHTEGQTREEQELEVEALAEAYRKEIAEKGIVKSGGRRLNPRQLRVLRSSRGSSEMVRPGVWRVRFSLGKNPETGKNEYSPWRQIQTKGQTLEEQQAEVKAFAETYKWLLNNFPDIVLEPVRIIDLIDRYCAGRRNFVDKTTASRELDLALKASIVFGPFIYAGASVNKIPGKLEQARESGKYPNTELASICELAMNSLLWASTFSASPVEWAEAFDPAKLGLKIRKTEQAFGKDMSIGSYLDYYHVTRLGAVRDSTYEREGQLVKTAKTLFDEEPLSSLTVPLIRQTYADARHERVMTESQLFEVGKLIRRALNQAVEDELIERNPACSIKLIAPEYKVKETLEAVQAADFKRNLLSLPMSPCQIATLLLLETGMRRGEVLGLQWENVSVTDRRIAVKQQLTKEMRIAPPKSKMSNRTLSISPSMAETLGLWMELQKEQFESRGIPWTEYAFVAHTFSDKAPIHGEPKGSGYIQPRNYNRWFEMFCVDNGYGRYAQNIRTIKRKGRTYIRGEAYEGITPHSLRHTQSTLLIGAGVDVKTVQARLGHSSPDITLSLYTRAVSQNDLVASALFDSITGEASVM